VIPSALPSGIGVVMFATNAPSATAGHIRRPQISTAANASPVGGQIAVTLEFASASARPSFADPK
jgi:hypothetical protein